MSGTEDPNRLQRIRETAYDLWQTEGRPDGRDHEFWVRAEALVDSQSSAALDEAEAESFPASDPPSFTP